MEAREVIEPKMVLRKAGQRLSIERAEKFAAARQTAVGLQLETQSGHARGMVRIRDQVHTPRSDQVLRARSLRGSEQLLVIVYVHLRKFVAAQQRGRPAAPPIGEAA